jgi:hypothetical protein
MRIAALAAAAVVFAGVGACAGLVWGVRVVWGWRDG